MSMEQKGVMVFRPQGRGEIIVSSPEDLVAKGISIDPEAIERTWGPDAVERYREAVIVQTTGKPLVKNVYRGQQAVTVFKGGGLDFSKGHSLHF